MIEFITHAVTVGIVSALLAFTFSVLVDLGAWFIEDAQGAARRAQRRREAAPGRG